MSTATGTQSDARFETSAAWAEAEASNNKLSSQVDQNAHQLHSAAESAATEAQHKSPSAAVDQLEHGLSEKTSTATAEGQANVQGYVAQAKSLVNSAFTTAQSYLPSSITSSHATTTTGTNAGAGAGGVSATVQDTASAALATTMGALETAKTTATPYIQRATEAASRTINGPPTTTASNASRPNEVSSTTAPLESGQHVVDSPYPQTTTGQSTKSAAV